MTFPVIASTGLTSAGSANPQTVNLPASISAGDLLLLIVDAIGTSSFTTPTGWTSLLSSTTGQAVFYKYASGTEGATLSLAMGASLKLAAVTYRITGTDGTTAPAIAALAETGPANSTFDPPSLSPSWGSADTLWLAIAAELDNRTVSAAPTSYTLQNNEASGGPSPGAVHIYARNNTTATEDPSAFTLSGSSKGYAITVGIRPGAAAVALLAMSSAHANAALSPYVGKASFSAMQVAMAGGRPAMFAAAILLAVGAARGRDQGVLAGKVGLAARNAAAATARLSAGLYPLAIRAASSAISAARAAARIAMPISARSATAGAARAAIKPIMAMTARAQATPAGRAAAAIAARLSAVGRASAADQATTLLRLGLTGAGRAEGNARATASPSLALRAINAAMASARATVAGTTRLAATTMATAKARVAPPGSIILMALSAARSSARLTGNFALSVVARTGAQPRGRAILVATTALVSLVTQSGSANHGRAAMSLSAGLSAAGKGIARSTRAIITASARLAGISGAQSRAKAQATGNVLLLTRTSAISKGASGIGGTTRLAASAASRSMGRANATRSASLLAAATAQAASRGALRFSGSVMLFARGTARSAARNVLSLVFPANVAYARTSITSYGASTTILAYSAATTVTVPLTATTVVPR